MDDEGPPPAPLDAPREPAESAVRRAARGRFEAMRTFGTLGTVGLSFALAIGLGAWLGVWLDGVTGWSPWCFIIFFILGFVAGVINVYRITSRSMK